VSRRGETAPGWPRPRVRIDPNIAEVHWVLGYVDTQKRRLDEALRRLGRAIEPDCSSADAYALMGGINTYRGEPAGMPRCPDAPMPLAF